MLRGRGLGGLGGGGAGLRSKSRIIRIWFILKKEHQPGVYVPLRALYLVYVLVTCKHYKDHP